MKRMHSKKSHSWWWDSHISRKNSKWLSENLEEMDRGVKEMLKLIEDEGDSFAKKAEMYYQKRPELISHVEDFYRMYRSLAERYDHVTGELRKNIPSELQTQGSGAGSDFGSEPPSPSLSASPERTPDHKPTRPKPSPRAAGFDFFLGSGGSDLSRKGSDGSSSSESESESESDDAKEVNGNVSSDGLHQRIIELENELGDVKEKLREFEESNSNGQCGHVENKEHVDLSSRILALEDELAASNEKLRISEEEIVRLKQKLTERNVSSERAQVELSLERKQVSELEERVAMSEADILDHKHEIEELKGAMRSSTQKFEADVLDRDHAIQELKTEIISGSERFLQEKSCLDAHVVNLEHAMEEVKTEVEELSREKLLLESHLLEKDHLIEELETTIADSAERFLQEKSGLEAEVLGLSKSHGSLESKLQILEDEIRRLEGEKIDLSAAAEKRGEEFNRNVDTLKLKVDLLTSENEELGAKVCSLIEEVKCRDDRIRQSDEQLQQLHLEHVKLIMEIEEAQRVAVELRERVTELQKVVERQRVAISDGAEGKREAIRQLCFSLEHYRDGYHQLRQFLQGHKRPAVLVS